MKGNLIILLVCFSLLIFGCTRSTDNIYILDSVEENDTINVELNFSDNYSLNSTYLDNDSTIFLDNSSESLNDSFEDDDIDEEDEVEDDIIVEDKDDDIYDNSLNDESQVIDNYIPEEEVVDGGDDTDEDFLMLKGDSIWVYGSFEKGEYDNYISIINEINSNSSVINYLFVWAGEISKKDGELAKVSFKNERIDYLAENLKGITLFPMIESSKEISNNLTEEDIEIVNEYLSNITRDLEYSGIHFDLEPINDATTQIVIDYSNSFPELIVSSAVVRYEPDFKDKIDFMVLMNYAQCQDNINDFSKITRNRYEKFRNLCVDNSQYCMHGLMFTETSCEKEDIDNYALKSLEIHDSFEDNEYIFGRSFFALSYRTNKIPSNTVIARIK